MDPLSGIVWDTEKQTQTLSCFQDASHACPPHFSCSAPTTTVLATRWSLQPFVLLAQEHPMEMWVMMEPGHQSRSSPWAIEQSIEAACPIAAARKIWGGGEGGQDMACREVCSHYSGTFQRGSHITAQSPARLPRSRSRCVRWEWADWVAASAAKNWVPSNRLPHFWCWQSTSSCVRHRRCLCRGTRTEIQKGFSGS